jgi:transcriptional regulator with XRE-family HTH domain
MRIPKRITQAKKYIENWLHEQPCPSCGSTVRKPLDREQAGILLAYIRDSFKLSQKDLEAATGLSGSTAKKWMRSEGEDFERAASKKIREAVFKINRLADTTIIVMEFYDPAGNIPPLVAYAIWASSEASWTPPTQKSEPCSGIRVV